MADNKTFQKTANISLVMQEIRINREISRIAISRNLGLDRSTITNIVSALLKDKLLVTLSEGQALSRGGRKPVLLGINKKFGTILGLEIQVGFYRACLLNLNGSIVWQKQGVLNNSEDFYESVIKVYEELLPEIEKGKVPLLGIGIGIPGHINPEEGIIIKSKPFGLENSDFKQILSEKLGLPVLVDNDANCCAWGVLEQRKEHKLQNLIYAIIQFHGKDSAPGDQELGLGIVINGRVYYGSSFAAGELWHSLTGDQTEEGSEEYFSMLFEKLALFVSVINPGHLFLGGEFTLHKEVITKVLNEGEGQYIKKLREKPCEVVFSCHEEYEASFGAASMFVEKLFMVPEIKEKEEAEISWQRMFEIRKARRSR